ncbi:MAG: hypothetical protein GY790_10540 [Bacteroidetes bacterium]|nr:hypothetical protein [Bacteroidota bacterium]
MKGKIKLMVILGMLMTSFIAYGQCGSDEFLDDCSSTLGSHTFIKAFNVELKPKKKENVEYSYVFSKGSNYMIIGCDQNLKGNRLIVSLYDRSHKLIASSYDRKTKKHYPDMVYPCSATGVYYIEATLEGSGQGCGVIILGFNKK